MHLKFEEQEKRLLARIDRGDSKFPQMILIDNISYCNLRCSMCPHKTMTRPKGKMDWVLYQKIIDEIAVNNPDARVWVTFFGEGLMLPDLAPRVRYAKEQGLKDVVLNSNGTLLNAQTALELIESGLDILYVGIDAYRRETYEKIRVGGNLDQVIEGVLHYQQALETHGRESQKIIVQFVEMDENRAEMEDFIRFWTERSISVKLRPKVSWAGKVEAGNLQETLERLPCVWAMNTISIADDGLVCLCAVDLECRVTMGDIRQRSIAEIWNGPLRQFREKHRQNQWDGLPEMCFNCRDWQSGYADYINVKP